MSRNDTEPFCSTADVKEKCFYKLLRYFLNISTSSVEEKIKNASSTYFLYTTGLKLSWIILLPNVLKMTHKDIGQFGSQ